jgi:hypothetical protein
MWPDQKVSDQGLGTRNYLTYDVAVLIPLEEVPFRHHTLVPVVLPLSEAFLELTPGNSCVVAFHCIYSML